MVAYLPRKDVDDTTTDETVPAAANRPGHAKPAARHALARDMLHGLTPDEFHNEAQSVADAKAVTPAVRARLRAQLVERLKTPVDAPSWGPDWVKQPEARDEDDDEKDGFRVSSLLPWLRKDEDGDDAEDDEDTAGEADGKTASAHPLNEGEQDDARVIARNMEYSRQVYHYRGLYALAAVAAIAIALLAMFVDYQIIRGDIWTRALANEFMVVPASLQSTLLFKSLQVVFAVLIIHFMLKITGVYGRNALVTAAFIFALVMIGCLGYLVAYNNMSGGTSATLEHGQDGGTAPTNNAIDKLFASNVANDNQAAADQQPHMMSAAMTGTKNDELSLSIPKPSQRSLANADSWFWLAFASVIFFIVTTVAALYMQTFENNVRNFLISRDYVHRRKQFAQLHLLELAEQGKQAA